MLLKVCKCGKLIPQEMGLCDKCKEAAGNRHKEYNAHRRNKEAAAFYVSREWRKLRGILLPAYDYIDLSMDHGYTNVSIAYLPFQAESS